MNPFLSTAPRLRMRFEWVLIAIILCVFYGTHFKRDWSLHVDQELTLAYNAILLNSGLWQEYYDHPGFFTILLLSFLMKVAHAIGYLSVANIEELNRAPSMFIAFGQMLVVAKHLAMLSCLGLCLITYRTLLRFLSAPGLCFVLTLAVFFSSGVIEHFINPRTELITFLLFLGSILSCYAWLSNRVPTVRAYLFWLIWILLILLSFGLSWQQGLFQEEAPGFGYQVGFLILVACVWLIRFRKDALVVYGSAVFLWLDLAALNKMQILFYAPIYYAWLAFFLCTPRKAMPALGAHAVAENSVLGITNVTIANTPPNAAQLTLLRQGLLLVPGIICLIFNLLFWQYITIAKSVYIHWALLLAFNAIFIGYWWYQRQSLAWPLIALNINFLLGFAFSFLFILAYTGHTYDYFKYFINPTLTLFHANQSVVGRLHLNETVNLSAVWWQVRHSLAFLLAPLQEIITQRNSQLIFVLLDASLFALVYRGLSLKQKYNVLICVIAAYAISLISQLRYSGNNYLFFYESIWFVLFVYLLSFLKSVSVRLGFATLLLGGTLLLTGGNIWGRLNDASNQHQLICTGGYMAGWHERIDMKAFSAECIRRHLK